jgi:pseudaminic acid cytidylyltransferase
VSVVCIIPARGGSKRLPGKNTRLFAGRPVISYSILAAKGTGLFDRILVSTDSPTVAGTAKEWGAEVPFLRPAELSGDFVPVDAAVTHALEWLGAAGPQADHVCCIYPVAPLVEPADIQEGYKHMLQAGAPASFSVAELPCPVERTLVFGDDGRIQMICAEHLLTRSQDLPLAYYDAGQFYWADAIRYLREKELSYDGAVPVVLPRWRAIDIHSEEEWRLAEEIYMARRAVAGGTGV